MLEVKSKYVMSFHTCILFIYRFLSHDWSGDLWPITLMTDQGSCNKSQSWPVRRFAIAYTHDLSRDLWSVTLVTCQEICDRSFLWPVKRFVIGHEFYRTPFKKNPKAMILTRDRLYSWPITFMTYQGSCDQSRWICSEFFSAFTLHEKMIITFFKKL